MKAAEGIGLETWAGPGGGTSWEHRRAEWPAKGTLLAGRKQCLTVRCVQTEALPSEQS